MHQLHSAHTSTLIAQNANIAAGKNKRETKELLLLLLLLLLLAAGYFRWCWCVPVAASNASHMNFDIWIWIYGDSLLYVYILFAWYIFHIKSMYTSYAYTLFHGPYCILYGVVCVLFFLIRHVFTIDILRLTHITSYFTGTRFCTTEKKWKKKNAVRVFARALYLTWNCMPYVTCDLCVIRTHFYTIHKYWQTIKRFVRSSCIQMPFCSYSFTQYVHIHTHRHTTKLTHSHTTELRRAYRESFAQYTHGTMWNKQEQQTHNNHTE